MSDQPQGGSRLPPEGCPGAGLKTFSVELLLYPHDSCRALRPAIQPNHAKSLRAPVGLSPTAYLYIFYE